MAVISHWPFDGNWEGLDANALPEIMSAIAIAYNERRQTLLGNTLVWATGAGHKSYPTPNDFYGIVINGNIMSQFRIQANSRITSGSLGSLLSTEGIQIPGGNLYFPISENHAQVTLSTATDIEFLSIKNTALCANYWLRLKDVLDNTYLFKCYPDNGREYFIGDTKNYGPDRVSLAADTHGSDISANDAWNGLDPVLGGSSGHVPAPMRWSVSYRDPIFSPPGTPLYRAGINYSGRLVYHGTEILPIGVDVIGGKIFALINKEYLRFDFTVLYGGEDLNILQGTGTEVIELDFSGWELGAAFNLNYDSGVLGVVSPFNGDLGGVQDNLGLMRFYPSGATALPVSPQTSYINFSREFDAQRNYMLIDISEYLTDKTTAT